METQAVRKFSVPILQLNWGMGAAAEDQCPVPLSIKSQSDY